MGCNFLFIFTDFCEEYTYTTLHFIYLHIFGSQPCFLENYFKVSTLFQICD